MGFRNGAWMSVFGVYPKTNGVTQIRGCTSRKNKDTGNYETDFSGYCSCIGTIAQKAATLQPSELKPVRIRLKDVEVKQTFDYGDDGKMSAKYTNFNIYDFDFGDGVDTTVPKSYIDQLNTAYEGISDDMDEEGLPF